jgi:PAS domain S-box-containing protein
LAVAAASGLRWLLRDYLPGGHLAYLTYHPLVALVAMLAGGGPGVLTTLLSAVVIDVWVVAPERHHTATEAVGLALFTTSCLVMSTMGEMLRRARRREKVGLEEQVAERTTHLEEAIARLRNETGERRRAEEALRQEHELSEAIIDTAPVIVLVLGPDGRVLRFNPFMERLTGRRLDEAKGRDWFDTFLPERDREPIRALFRRALGDQRTRANVNPILTRDGREIDIEWYDAPLRGPDGALVGLLCVGQDITERKRAEEALRNTEHRLQAILSTAADGIITIDQHGTIQSTNPAAERLFGYPAAEMVGQNVKMLMPPPYRDEHDGYLARYRQTGETHIIGIGREVTARRKDGSVFLVELAVSEVDHLKLFTGIIHDVTRRKQLEREVVEIASLEQRRIGQDLHDTVGQELTGLNLMVSALRARPATGPEPMERIAEGLRRCQQALRAVLRGLLPVAVDSGGLMSALADLAERTQQEGKVACRFDCPRPVRVADNVTATQLYLIAREAVHNAVKHARAENVRITLEPNHLLVLRVQDDGIGMPARPGGHGGVGLHIMRNRARILGAMLTIEPAQPMGTVVTCALVRSRE